AHGPGLPCRHSKHLPRQFGSWIERVRHQSSETICETALILGLQRVIVCRPNGVGKGRTAREVGERNVGLRVDTRWQQNALQIKLVPTKVSRWRLSDAT